MKIKLLLPLFIASSLLSAGASAGDVVNCEELKLVDLDQSCSLVFGVTSPDNSLKGISCKRCYYKTGDAPKTFAVMLSLVQVKDK